MDELDLFAGLSRNTRFKKWVEDKLANEYTILSQMSDVDLLRRAQGRAQLLKAMMDLLDKGAAR